MNCTYIYFSKTKVFLEILIEIGFKYIYNPYIIIFNFYISVRQENAGRKWYQAVFIIVRDLTLMKYCEE